MHILLVAAPQKGFRGTREVSKKDNEDDQGTGTASLWRKIVTIESFSLERIWKREGVTEVYKIMHDVDEVDKKL